MIGVLIFPDFQLLDAAGPVSVFEIAARFAGGDPAIRLIAATPGPVLWYGIGSVYHGVVFHAALYGCSAIFHMRIKLKLLLCIQLR